MMRRKDCDYFCVAEEREGARRPARVVRLGVLLALAACAPAFRAYAGSVRLWPSAVVVGETIRVDDLCELSGFDTATERRLAELVVMGAPPPGGSRVVHMDTLRTVLAAGGANMASVTMRGATKCAVVRPADVATPHGAGHVDVPGGTKASGSPTGYQRAAVRKDLSTLRQAVIEYLDAALARYGGRADVAFDQAAVQLLDLSGPAYEFRVRRRNRVPLGLVQMEVDVLADGRTVQTVPIVARVSMIRNAVVARRAINQGATIQAQEVELVPLSVTQLNKLGIDDTARVIGQRAKRFIAAGSLIDPNMLESVPLVTRGQLVTLTSVAGAVRVVTTAKALQDGLLGETITVRAADNKRLELDAVVVGPAAVRIGTGSAARPPATNAALERRP